MESGTQLIYLQPRRANYPLEIDCESYGNKKDIGAFVNSSSDNSPVNKPIQQRLTEAVTAVAELFERRQVVYALIGGLSAAFRGNKRSTEDADFLLHVSAINLPGLLQEMKDAGCDFDQLGAIRQWNTDGILVIQWPSGVQVDLLKPVVPIFHRILQRAKLETFGAQSLRVVDAEGLMLMKLIAFRPLDQEDIRGVLLANSKQLDLDWVRTEALLAGIPGGRLEAFEELIREYYIS